MVVTSLPATSPIGSWQARTEFPPTRTLHDPHWPSPHPYFVPVRPRSSRRTERSVRPDSTGIDRSTPFTFRRMSTMTMRPSNVSTAHSVILDAGASGCLGTHPTAGGPTRLVASRPNAPNKRGTPFAEARPLRSRRVVQIAARGCARRWLGRDPRLDRLVAAPRGRVRMLPKGASSR
jgi:hypothetical protein